MVISRTKLWFGVAAGTALLLVSVLPVKKATQPTPASTALEPAALDVDTLEAVYANSYNRGYNRFMEQEGHINRTVKTERYMVERAAALRNENLSAADQAAIDEIASQGYVDGYHAAGASFVCPRGQMQ